VNKVQTNPYRAYRQLERKLFLGVPERPESFWEREGNHQMQGRMTGRSLLGEPVLPVLLEGAQTLATIIYRPESGEVLFEPVKPPQPQRIGPSREDATPDLRQRAAASTE
jgi:hypothetical protein